MMFDAFRIDPRGVGADAQRAQEILHDPVDDTPRSEAVGAEHGHNVAQSTKVSANDSLNSLSDLDRFDHAILRELGAHGRISLTALAARVGLTKTPVQARFVTSW